MPVLTRQVVFHAKHLWRVFGVVFVACWTWGSAAWGFDSNYHDFLLGQRATGMGAAFTAVANDPSAAFYNPAGLVGFERLKVSVNLTIYGFEYRQVENGLARDQGGVSLERLEFVLFPSTTGVASRFGGKDKKGRPLWAGGIAFLIPSRTQLRFRTGLTEQLQTSQRSTVYTLHRDGQTFLVGPSLARRFGPVSIGASVFYAHRFFSWLLANNLTIGDCDPNNLLSCKTTQANGTISSVEGWAGSINFRLGLMVEFSPKWQLGFMASFSSIPVWGDGYFLSQRFGLTKDENKDDPPAQYVERRGLSSHSPMPWEFRLGVAYRPVQSVLLALDVVLYLPMEYELLNAPGILDLFQYPQVIKRSTVVNVHLGLEWKIKPRIPFRFGLFTNLSSAPSIPEQTVEAHLNKVHMFGMTTSIGIGFGNTTFDLGVSASYGEGDFARLRPEQGFRYERAPLRQVFVHIYLSGATEFLGYGIQKLVDRVAKLPIGGNKRKKIERVLRRKKPKRRAKERPAPRRKPAARGGASSPAKRRQKPKTPSTPRES